MALTKEAWRERIMQMAMGGTTASPYQEFNKKTSPGSYPKPTESLKNLQKPKETYEQLKLPIKGAKRRGDRTHELWQQYLANRLADIGGGMADLHAAQRQKALQIQPLTQQEQKPKSPPPELFMHDGILRQVPPSRSDEPDSRFFIDDYGREIPSRKQKYLDWRYNINQ